MLGERGRERLRGEAARIAEESGEHARKRRRPESPPWAKKEFERFHPHVALELLGLRALVMDTPEDDVGHALRLCLSSILVKVMKAGPEAPRDGAEKRIGRGIRRGSSPIGPMSWRAAWRRWSGACRRGRRCRRFTSVTRAI